MIDWAGALAHAFRKHADDCGRDPTKSNPEMGTTGTTAQRTSTAELVPPKCLLIQQFSGSGTTGTTGTTGIRSTLQTAGSDSRRDGEFEERAALIEEGAHVPRAWAEAFARLDLMPRPASVPEERWRQIIDDGGRFLDRWGRHAADLGWSEQEVFGTDSLVPVPVLEPAGLVPMIMGGVVEVIERHRAVITLPCGSRVVRLRCACGSWGDMQYAGDAAEIAFGPPTGGSCGSSGSAA
jgi:hypothetical protein